MSSAWLFAMTSHNYFRCAAGTVLPHLFKVVSTLQRYTLLGKAACAMCQGSNLKSQLSIPSNPDRGGSCFGGAPDGAGMVGGVGSQGIARSGQTY